METARVLEQKRQKEILIVEDEALIAMALKERMEAMGYKISGVLDRGELVLQHVQTSHPDLILMDIHLKGEQDGIETAENLKGQSDVPVIFLTSYSNKSMIERAKKSSPYGYVIKSIDDNNLHITIDIALNNHKNHKQMNIQLENEITLKEDLITKSHQELDTFTYSVAHAIRGPLASIMGLVNLWNDECCPNNKTSYLNMINQMVGNLNTNVKSIVDYNDYSKSKPTKTKVDLVTLAEELMAEAREADPTGKIDFLVDINLGNNFKTDKEKITAILRNLLNNAVKYHNTSLKYPFVKISATKMNGETQISVSDNGVGMKREQQVRAFDLFYRGHERSTGPGLGLSIVKEAVEKMNGSVQIDSRYEMGTTVSITF